MLNKFLRALIGGGKRFYAVIIATIIFVFIIPKDNFSWGTFVTFLTAWAGLDTVRKGE